MMNEKNYYQEIQRCLQDLSEKERKLTTANSFFDLCQQFYWLYSIRERTSSAEKVLQNYFDSEDYIAQRKYDENADVKPRFELKDKLYLELLSEIYDKYYKDKMSFNDFTLHEEWRELVSKCFSEKPSALLDALSDIMDYALQNDLEDYVFYNRHDFSNIHKSMNAMREGLNTPIPSVEDSVEKVIAQERLETLVDYLKCDNVAGALFTIAPVRRALWDGEYKAYIPKNGHKTVFFNLKGEYNTVELKSRIMAMKNLLKQYDDIMKELNGYRRMSI